MTGAENRDIHDYPILDACRSDLRTCSKDDSNESKPVYMYDEEGMFAVNFDGVMRCFCKQSSPTDGPGPMGVARSVDALYVGQDESSWDKTLSLIEFKNGNLREKQRRALGKREREEFTSGLVRAVEGMLQRKVGSIGWQAYGELSESIARGIENYVGRNLGRGGVATVSSGDEHHKGDYFTIETIKTKATCSALALQYVLDVPAKFIRDHVDFVLVYNPERNPDPADDSGMMDDNTVPSIPAIESRLPSMLARCAKRPLRRFGLRENLGAFFRDVLTCTPEELRSYLKSKQVA